MKLQNELIAVQQAKITELNAEIAALRQDAKRYRYMRGFERTTVANEIGDLSWSSSFETQDEIDDAIDDAIAQAVQP